MPATAQWLTSRIVCLLPCTDNLLMSTAEEDGHKNLSGWHVVSAVTNLGCHVWQSFRLIRHTSLNTLSTLLLYLPTVIWLLRCCHHEGSKEMWAVFRSQGHFLMPVQELSQSRRVVVSHNVDKALKEGNGSYFSNDSQVCFTLKSFTASQHHTAKAVNCYQILVKSTRHETVDI